MTAIITQVSETTAIINEKNSKQHSPSLLNLSLRGARIDVDRDTLLTLPESILVVMFPEGFALDGEDNKQTFCNVDFSMQCLQYMLEYFQKVKKEYKRASNEFVQDAYLAHLIASDIPLNPLLTKQGIIVLHEELEYFVVLDRLIEEQSTKITLSEVKRKSGDLLVKEDMVFDALLKNIDNENDVAEHHLVEMLCSAGFSKEDHWQQRSSEPSKTCISSLSLVSLCQNDRLHIGQKLVMFWRKPARKCWWTNNRVNIENKTLKLWCRRTWTLELALL